MSETLKQQLLNYLKKNYGWNSPKVISEALNTSARSVIDTAYDLIESGTAIEIYHRLDFFTKKQYDTDIIKNVTLLRYPND